MTIKTCAVERPAGEDGSAPASAAPKPAASPATCVGVVTVRNSNNKIIPYHAPRDNCLRCGPCCGRVWSRRASEHGNAATMHCRLVCMRARRLVYAAMPAFAAAGVRVTPWCTQYGNVTGAVQFYQPLITLVRAPAAAARACSRANLRTEHSRAQVADRLLRSQAQYENLAAQVQSNKQVASAIVRALKLSPCKASISLVRRRSGPRNAGGLDAIA